MKQHLSYRVSRDLMSMSQSHITIPQQYFLRSISEISSCFLGPRPWHIEIRHRVKQNPQLICSDLKLSN